MFDVPSGTGSILFRDDIVWLPRGFEFLCGLSEAKRKRRSIMAFKAFIDDSGSKGQGKILMLGGLYGSAEALASTADHWERELRASQPRSIEYFKCYEAKHLSGEFNHWGRKGRDEKVLRLASVVDRKDLVMIFAAVDIPAHRQTEMAVGRRIADAKKHPFNQPYLLAFLSLMVNVGMETYKRQSDQKVEVVIDEHVIFRRDALAQYELVLSILPPWLRPYMPVQPLFRDDKDFVLLQAADLLMGNARLVVEKASRWPTIEFSKLKVSPFTKYHWAQPLGEIAARQIEQLSEFPKGTLNVTVRREDS